MDQPRWIPQLYGYTVCLIAVITILLSLSSLVNNVFEFAEPEMSFAITTTGDMGRRSLATSTLMLLVGGILFALHWKWLRGSRTTIA